MFKINDLICRILAVDKLWADWQQAHPDESYLPEPGTGGNATGHELDDLLFPWRTTPADVINHHDLDHTYVINLV